MAVAVWLQRSANSTSCESDIETTCIFAQLYLSCERQPTHRVYPDVAPEVAILALAADNDEPVLYDGRRVADA